MITHLAANQRIVVSDGDQTFLDLIEEILTDEGYTQVICVPSYAAIPVIRETKPGLLVFELSPVDPAIGWHILKTVRQDALTQGIPMIVCSTHPPLLHAYSGKLQAMGCEILEKPFRIEDLLYYVRLKIGVAQ